MKEIPTEISRHFGSNKKQKFCFNFGVSEILLNGFVEETQRNSNKALLFRFPRGNSNESDYIGISVEDISFVQESYGVVRINCSKLF